MDVFKLDIDYNQEPSKPELNWESPMIGSGIVFTGWGGVISGSGCLPQIYNTGLPGPTGVVCNIPTLDNLPNLPWST